MPVGFQLVSHYMGKAMDAAGKKGGPVGEDAGKPSITGEAIAAGGGGIAAGTGGNNKVGKITGEQVEDLVHKVTMEQAMPTWPYKVCGGTISFGVACVPFSRV